MSCGSVDVIVPCYRYGHYLEQCVGSVLDQEAVSTRVLVIDDASPDQSGDIAEALAQRDSRVTTRRHAQNRGHIATYNEGLDWATADYVLLLSADDYLLPGSLQRAAELMNANQEVGFSFGNAIELSDDGSMRPILTPAASATSSEPGWTVLSGRAFIRLSATRNIVPTPTALVRTSLQRRIGYYREHLPHTGDMEMWLRAAAHAPVGVVAAPQAVYRRHAANMSMGYRWLPDLHQRRAAVDSFLNECAAFLDDPEAVREQLLRGLGREALGAASAAFNEGDFELVNALARYGIDTSPATVGSLPWLKLLCKRLIGRNAWLAARTAWGWRPARTAVRKPQA